jgi:hypothetical protein
LRRTAGGVRGVVARASGGPAVNALDAVYSQLTGTVQERGLWCAANEICLFQDLLPMDP